MVPTRRIERRSLALQASAITRLARSAWDGAGDGDRTRYLSLTGRARHLQRITSMVRARGLEPRYRGNRPRALPLDDARMNGGSHGDRTREMAQRAGFEPTSHRLTAERVALATTSERMAAPGGIAPPSPGSEPGILLLNEGASNGRVGRTRTSTHLRPRQVGYRLPYDPKNLELG